MRAATVYIRLQPMFAFGVMFHPDGFVLMLAVFSMEFSWDADD